MSGDKALHLETPPLLSKEIMKSNLALDSYLKQMVSDNRRDEATRMKLAKARETKRNYYLKQKEKQEQAKKKWTCKLVAGSRG